MCNGLKVVFDQNQYVTLGDLSVACITNPSDCGSTGGTLSFWIKYEQQQIYSPIIGTTPREHAGFEIGLLNGAL